MIAAHRFTFTLATLFLTTTALAAPPECRYSIGLRGYDAGYQSERMLLDTLWNTYGDCHDFERFFERAEPPYGTDTTTRYGTCRNAGIRDAFDDKFAEIHYQCASLCIGDGVLQGERNGMQTCAVADTYGAKRSLIPLCSLQASVSCKVAFENYVMDNCPEKITSMGRANFDQLLESSCVF